MASDRRLLERIARVYTPRPLSPSERSAFTARLRARLDREDRRGPWLPALGAATVVAVAWAVFVPSPTREPLPEGAAAAGVGVLLTQLEVLEDEAGLDSSGLPESYALLDRLMEEPVAAPEPAQPAGEEAR
jgi:hypothetical protein